MIRRPPRSTQSRSSAASDVYKRQILSNDIDAPAKEIADLYKRRWQIELFFRVMKQTLKITHFIGRSENAVRIQIAVALIAFLLLRMLNKMSQDKQTLLETTRLVRTNLMHRKDFTRLKQLQSPKPLDSRPVSYTHLRAHETR